MERGSDGGREGSKGGAAAAHLDLSRSRGRGERQHDSPRARRDLGRAMRWVSTNKSSAVKVMHVQQVPLYNTCTSISRGKYHQYATVCANLNVLSSHSRYVERQAKLFKQLKTAALLLKLDNEKATSNYHAK
jgi:hypothetical protein